MEETKQYFTQKSRLNCENAFCNRERKYFCKDHKTVLCNTCYTALHLRCCIDEIADKKKVEECIDNIMNLLSKIMINSEVLKTGNYIKDFDLEIKRHWESLQTIKQKFENAVENDEFVEFEIIRKETIQLQKDFTESQLFIEYTKYITLLDATNAGCLNANRDPNADAQHLKKYKERIAKEIEDIKQKELDQKFKEETYKLVNEFKDRIKQLESTIAEEIKIKAEYIEKTKTLETEMQKQIEESKLEIKSFKEECEQHMLKAKELNQLLQSIYESNVNKIYEKNLGSKISDIKNLSQEINLSDSKQVALLIELESNKIKLPNIKRIKIDQISDNDADLNSFLSNCTPDQLEFFAMNRNHKGDIGIKADYYVKALCKMFMVVTKEIFIECFKITESDLEQIVKSSCNAERLIIMFCDVSCSTTLDFTTASKYNINFLSFFQCGLDSRRSSDWMSDPSAFERIVEAICKSGLKDSLQTFDIKSCQLNKTTVQGLFSKHGMGTITVVENAKTPLTV